MKKGRVTVDLIKDKAVCLFLSHGYNNTSMSDIADACLIKKASLYHHIENREMLLIQVVKDTCDVFVGKLSELGSCEFTADKYIAQFIRLSKSFFRFDGGGFLIMKLVCEVGGTIPEVKRIVAKFSVRYIKELAGYLEAWHGKLPAKKMAERLFAYINGAMLHSMLEENALAINKVWRSLKDMAR